MLIDQCICGVRRTLPQQIHGLPMLQCACGILRQQVELSQEELARWYEDLYFSGIYTHSPVHDREIARLRLEAYDLPEGARILDVGSGWGAFVDEARKAGYDAWGQDLADAGYKRDPEHIWAAPLEAIAFPPFYFDAVTVHDVLEHVPDPRAFLQEISRILRPGGTLIVDFPRFHHEDGLHHWKEIEHLWMLTEDQLRDLLSSEGFEVKRTEHPITSKVVLYGENTRKPSPVKILVPPGIGDGYWVAVKLRGFLQARGIDLPEVYVHKTGPARAAEFWQRVPFVRWGGFAEFANRRIIRQAYVEGTHPVQKNVGAFDFFLSFNGTLGKGRSLQEALPGPEEWDLPLFRTKRHELASTLYPQVYGDYIVTAFWDKSFYRKWLAEFSEGQIVETLRLLQDQGLQVIVTGAEWDKGGIAERVAASDARFESLIGETSFGALTGLLAGSKGVFGFPAGSTLLGPLFGAPTLLLWSERQFPRPFWTNTVDPDARYLPVDVSRSPEEVASAFIHLTQQEGVPV